MATSTDNRAAQHGEGPVTLRGIRAGEDYQAQVEGGFVRKRAPCDGLLLETRERCYFLTTATVLAELTRLKEQR